MQTNEITSAFEVKFLAETGLFEGYASVFNITDSVGDRILPGAFAKSLAEWRAKGQLPPMLWQHDQKKPIGKWLEMTEDGHGLFVSGSLFIEDIPKAREALRLLKERVVTGLSIGYRARESVRDGDIRLLTDIELIEVSMVTFPANDKARISRVKSAAPSERELEAALRDAGLSHRQAKGLLAHGYRALSRDAAADDALTHKIAAVECLTRTINLLNLRKDNHI